MLTLPIDEERITDVQVHKEPKNFLIRWEKDRQQDKSQRLIRKESDRIQDYDWPKEISEV